MLVGFNNPHILGASPCRGAGSTNVVETGETDIDGEPRAWGGAVDIGCDQFVATNITGALDMNIEAPFTNALVNTPLRFRSAICGKADIHTWSVAIPGGTMGYTNNPDWTYTWATTGTYAVTLSATSSGALSGIIMPSGATRICSAPASQWFGGPGMTPVAADYDGDGKADAAVYVEEEGRWYVLMSGDGSIQTCVLGGPGLKAVPADYNGDDKADPVVYELATGAWFGFLSGPDGYTLSTALLGGQGYFPLGVGTQ